MDCDEGALHAALVLARVGRVAHVEAVVVVMMRVANVADLTVRDHSPGTAKLDDFGSVFAYERSHARTHGTT